MTKCLIDPTLVAVADAYGFDVLPWANREGWYITTDKDSGFYWDTDHDTESFWRELAKHFYDNGYNVAARW
jgi:hypothetical protein